MGVCQQNLQFPVFAVFQNFFTAITQVLSQTKTALQQNLFNEISLCLFLSLEEV